jgi:hypothetical protein
MPRGDLVRRVLSFLLVILWIAIIVWAVAAYRQQQRPAPEGLPSLAEAVLKPEGTWETVTGEPLVEKPFVLTLASDQTIRAVQIGGLAEPKTSAEAVAIVARLKELAPPGTNLYVHMEPRAADDTREPPVATVYLPPAATPHDKPFPYEKSQVLGATLVQEGLARVDTEELYRYRTEFQDMQAEAKRQHYGIWARGAEAAASSSTNATATATSSTPSAASATATTSTSSDGTATATPSNASE